MNLSKLFEDIQSQEMELFEKKLAAIIEKAYLQGVEEGSKLAQAKYEYPDHMKKEDLAKYFNCSLAQVEKIIRMDGFPRTKAVQAHFPKDKVFEWADKNTEYMNERLGIYISHNEWLRLIRGQKTS